MVGQNAYRKEYINTQTPTHPHKIYGTTGTSYRQELVETRLDLWSHGAGLLPIESFILGRIRDSDFENQDITLKSKVIRFEIFIYKMSQYPKYNYP